MTNKIKYLNADGEYFETEGNEAYYMTEDELYDTSNSFLNTLEDIKIELQDLCICGWVTRTLHGQL